MKLLKLELVLVLVLDICVKFYMKGNHARRVEGARRFSGTGNTERCSTSDNRKLIIINQFFITILSDQLSDKSGLKLFLYLFTFLCSQFFSCGSVSSLLLSGRRWFTLHCCGRKFMFLSFFKLLSGVLRPSLIY